MEGSVLGPYKGGPYKMIMRVVQFLSKKENFLHSSLYIVFKINTNSKFSFLRQNIGLKTGNYCIYQIIEIEQKPFKMCQSYPYFMKKYIGISSSL